MKCAHCGASVELVDSQMLDDYTRQRDLLCANGHHSKTYEVIESAWGEVRYRMPALLRTVMRRAERHARDAEIARRAAAGEKALALAYEFDLSESAISRTRRKFRPDLVLKPGPKPRPPPTQD